jgi:xylulokinase
VADPRQGVYLGFDVGTQGTKGIAFDARTRAISARAGCAYDLLPGLPAGAAEQHPQTWIEAVREVARELLRGVDRSRVAGVAVSGQQHGAVLLDAAGEVVRPAKLWCDTTTADEAARISRALGRPVPTGFTAPKLLWCAEREPERWARTAHVLLPHDFVNFRLTGRMTMEAGDASGTGLFDPVARAFDPRALAAVDPRLAEMLPPLIASSEPAGALSEAGAALLGLDPGVLVASGGGDNMLSAIGSGATRTGVVVVSLGTSGTVFCYTPAPVIDPEGAIAPFCDSTGGYLPLLCTMNATGPTEEVRRAFSGADLATLEAEAARVPAGAEGLLFLPYLQGERVPDLPHATGALLGVTPGRLARGHLFRAAMEGATLVLAAGIERMKALGIAVDSVRTVGGGSQSALWRQIVADVLEVPVRRLAETESGAFGAALQALWAARVAAGERVSADAVAAEHVQLADEMHAPDPAAGVRYREAREQLLRATARLFGAPGVPHEGEEAG